MRQISETVTFKKCAETFLNLGKRIVLGRESDWLLFDSMRYKGEGRKITIRLEDFIITSYLNKASFYFPCGVWTDRQKEQVVNKLLHEQIKCLLHIIRWWGYWAQAMKTLLALSHSRIVHLFISPWIHPTTPNAKTWYNQSCECAINGGFQN